MADNSIDLVVSKEAFDQLERLLLKIKEADKAIETLNVNAGKNPTTPSGGEANAAENAKIIAQMKELTAEINKQAEAATKLAAARKPSSKAITQDTIDTRAFNAAETQRLQLSSQKIGLYQKLDIQYKQAIKTAQDLGAAEDKLTNGYVAAAAKAKELGAQLQAIDASVGKYGRNVGNYASGWNGLANSVNQLTREAPAFANSLNTGFMALSNNIPILFDELNQLKIKNQELAATGKPTESVFKTLGAALFSWQTALSVGVTLLTLYGERVVDFLTGAKAKKEALEKEAKAIEDRNKAEEDSLNTLAKYESEEISRSKTLLEKAKNLTLSMKDRLEAVKELQQRYPDYLGSLDKQKILAGDTADEEDRLNIALVLRGKALASQELLAKNSLEQMKAQIEFERVSQKGWENMQKQLNPDKSIKDLAKYNRAQYDAAKATNTAQIALNEKLKPLKEEEKLLLSVFNANSKYTSAVNDAPPVKAKADKSSEEAAKKEEERLERQYKALLSNLERQKEIDKDVLTSFEGGIDEKIRLSLQLARDEINIANIVFREKERLAKGDVSLITVAINEKDTAEENAAQENLKRVKKYYEEYAKLAQEYYEKNPPLFMETKERKAEREKQEAEQKKKLEESANYMKSFIADFASSSNFEGVLHLFDGPNSLFERIKKGSAFTKESWKEDTVAMMEAAQEMYNFIANASQQNFDAEYERLDKQKEVALQFAGESASAREKVEEDYEAKKKEIVNRENKAKKKQAIFNIGIDTAQAILSALATIPPPANIPFSIAVGLLGAAQMAVVAAQKIPQYFDGTDNHPGGLALINDGKGANYKETVVTPDGKVRQYSGRDVMIDAPAGTQVFTHDQWNNELNTMMREKGVSMSNSFNSRSGLSYAEMDSIIAKHFSKITTQSTVIDRNGFNTFVSNGSSKTIRNQSRYSGTGFSV